jgi:large subunit ribosomal protein L23
MKGMPLIKPVTTEKINNLEAKFTYAFWIDKRASKIDIKNSIKELYGAEVESVRIINTPAKKRLVRRMVTDKKPAMKKALITLKGRKKLDINKFTKESQK